MSMKNFSKHVIAVANEHSSGITNLELQKVMYFAIGDYIAEKGIDPLVKSIYNEPFEAWPYGPVVRSVYFEHKLNGNRKIRKEATMLDDFNPLNSYIKKYLKIPIKQLVEESHEHSIWKDNVESIMRHDLIEYELEDIRDAFN